MPLLLALVAILLVALVVRRKAAPGQAKAKSAPHLGKWRGRKACKWRAIGDQGATLREFECETCGITAYSVEARGPKDCKKDFGKSAL
ncbi:MAG: hypothetical protein ACRBCL_00440 [Maritimibacter sp.]